jgi:hypothetical protein
LKGEKTVMNAAQIKGKIRKLNWTDKIEIYRWLDKEAEEGLFCRVGMHRSLAIRQEIEQKCKGATPERTRVTGVQGGERLRPALFLR